MSEPVETGRRREGVAQNEIDPNQGVACPACGCRHAPKRWTRRVGLKNLSERECRHCGRRFRTVERIEAVES